MQIVGLADAAVRESRERVRSAIRNSGFGLPGRAVVVNLAPADLRKAGNHLDLPIALALLGAQGLLPEGTLRGRIICGELSLDGSVRAIRGGLALAELARTAGARELLIPVCNMAEAALLEGVRTIGVTSLAEAVEHLVGTQPLAPAAPLELDRADDRSSIDLADVRGQPLARRALEIAAAGGHNLLLIGPPGSGKTLLSRCLPGLLPALSCEESLLVTRIHSAAGMTLDGVLERRRPFRAPHACISTAGLVGGGAIPRPGEISLAHHGVLFLDELPEFRRDALESLRQPLEAGSIVVARVGAQLAFPARFSLVAAMNPCRCGHLGDPRHECRCTPAEIERYRNRVSGPLLDRIDLHAEVPALTLGELKDAAGEPTEAVAKRVLAARRRQRLRFGRGAPAAMNAELEDSLLRRYCRLEAEAQGLLDSAFERLGLSARAVTRLLKVSRTIADLRGADCIGAADIAEAIQYRSLDRRMAD